MNIDRKVIEQALDALNHGITEMNHRGCAIECMPLHHATKALREALAQPQTVQQDQCPECDGTGTVAGSQAHFPCPLCTSPQAPHPLTRAQFAEAWISTEHITNATERQIAYGKAVEATITKGTT